MRKLNAALAVAIVLALLVPGIVVGTMASACCGVEPVNLVVDAPAEACVGDEVQICATYTVVPDWDPYEPFDTGLDVTVTDPLGVVTVTNLLLDTGQAEAPMDYDACVPLVIDEEGIYTYDVVAWSYTSWGRMQVSVIGGEIMAEVCCEGVCETIDPCVEQEIRDRWEAECPSCNEAQNHGAYVSCRANIVSEYVDAGLVDEEGSSCLVHAVAKTDCGQKVKEP